MKKIGMIGGLAWPSSVDYYRIICSRTNAWFEARGGSAPLASPPMVIESVNISETRNLRGKPGDDASWEQYEAFFRDCIVRLENAGAQLIFIASNTPHMRFAGITRDARVPLVSIIDATANAVRAHGAERGLILGTSVTMRSDVYPQRFSQLGIEPVDLEDEQFIDDLQSLIDNELYTGQIDKARDWMLNRCQHYAKLHNVDTISLACTELPLAFPEFADDAIFEVDGLTFINTTLVHAEAVLDAALADAQVGDARYQVL